jgi:hypothetical protein
VHHAAERVQPVVDLDVGAARAKLRGHAAGSRIVPGPNRGDRRREHRHKARA